MPDSENVTLGEVNRSVKRLESEMHNSVQRVQDAVTGLSGQMLVALGPISELKVHVHNAQTDINKLWINAREVEERIENRCKEVRDALGEDIQDNKERINALVVRAAGAAGVVTGAGFLIKFIFKF